MAVYWLKKDETNGGYIITDNVEYAILDKIKIDSLISLGLQPIGNTPKRTGVDPGVLHEMSVTDDYLYICVVGGVAGVAIWKKILMTESR